MPAPQSRAVSTLRIAVPVAVVAALVVSVLGLAGSPSAAAAVGGVLAVVLPPAAAVALWHPGSEVPGYQRLFAAAFAVAGVAQLLRMAAARGSPSGHDAAFPSAGDLLAIA